MEEISGKKKIYLKNYKRRAGGGQGTVLCPKNRTQNCPLSAPRPTPAQDSTKLEVVFCGIVIKIFSNVVVFVELKNLLKNY